MTKTQRNRHDSAPLTTSCRQPRAVHIGEGGRGRAGFPHPGELLFFSNIVFEFAKLFLVAILVRNYKKVDLLTENISLQCEFQITVMKNLSRQSQYDVSYENNDFVIWATCGLEFGIRNQ